MFTLLERYFFTINSPVLNPDKPQDIIKGIIDERKKLMNGYGGNKKARDKFQEALNPTLFTFSLTGEPTLYPLLGEMIKYLRGLGKITFLVSNGLNPNVIKKLEKSKSLPTQLVISLNAPNKRLYDFWHNS